MNAVTGKTLTNALAYCGMQKAFKEAHAIIGAVEEAVAAAPQSMRDEIQRLEDLSPGDVDGECIRVDEGHAPKYPELYDDVDYCGNLVLEKQRISKLVSEQEAACVNAAPADKRDAVIAAIDAGMADLPADKRESVIAAIESGIQL